MNITRIQSNSAAPSPSISVPAQQQSSDHHTAFQGGVLRHVPVLIGIRPFPIRFPVRPNIME